MFFIGDIGGQFEATKRLISKLPYQDEKICLLGDLVDRGPQSRQLIEFAMSDPRIITLLGNHEHMMISWLKKDFSVYSSRDWFNNGGFATLESYGATEDYRQTDELRALVPKEHLEWLEQLPKQCWEEVDGKRILGTHAPLTPRMKLAEIDTLGITKETSMFFDESVIWNREEPVEREFFQVFGHNSHWGYVWFETAGRKWAVCLDMTRFGLLTALHFPTMEVWQESFVKQRPKEMSL